MTTAREYFKSNPGFERFLLLCRYKYISLSRVGGCVKLKKTAEYIAETGCAGYQENILRELVSDALSLRCKQKYS